MGIRVCLTNQSSSQRTMDAKISMARSLAADLVSRANAARSSCFNTTAIAGFGREFLPSSFCSSLHGFDMLQKPMFLLGARIIAKQRKVGGALQRQDDHFAENLANGADEIE